MAPYEQTRRFWDQVFAGHESSAEASLSSGDETLDAALDTLVEARGRVLDFGCGSGRMLLRLSKVRQAECTGVDLSSSALEAAEALFTKAGGSVHLKQGSTEVLDVFADSAFDGAILSNILDNLTEADALRTIDALARILKPGGRLLVKMNPYLDAETLEAEGLEHVEESLYQEPGGLYLLNHGDAAWFERFAPAFTCIQETKVWLGKNREQENRLYVFQRREASD